MPAYFYIKQCLDIFFALVFVLLLFPLFICISLLIFFSMGSPVFFVQKRGGFNNTVFNVYKFRTMKSISENERDNSDFARLTSLGKFIRKLSLDELPQLFNILKGEMSFIGPRAFLAEYLDLYTDDQKKRHHVKPGITGLSQVNGRNSISWEERFKYDLEYVKRFSFGLDFYIFFKTFYVIFFQKGINSSNNVTMKKFEGTKI
jgi:lipopolysaccharide/colanic/teichoic acid biosynthesis glycosyltransferase